MGKVKYNWESLKLEYVSGSVSLRGMAKAHGIPLPTLRHQSARNSWVIERKKYRNKIVTASARKRCAAAVLDILKFDEKTELACDAAVKAASEALTGTFSVKDAEMYMKVIKLAQDVKYRALRIPAAVQPIELSRSDSPVEQIERQIEAQLEGLPAEMLEDLAHAARDRDDNE